MGRRKSGRKSGSAQGWFLQGPDPRRGRGPAKGHGGRPPDEFTAFLKSLRDHPIFRARLQALALEDPDPERARRFAAWLLERTDGKPVQPMEVSGGVTLTWEERRQRLEELLGRAAQRVASPN